MDRTEPDRDPLRAEPLTEEELRELIGGAPGVRAPSGFADDVMAQVNRSRRPRRRVLVFPALAAAAAILIMAAIVGRGWLVENAAVPEKTPGPEKAPVAALPAPWPDGSPRARDLVRRARLFLAVAEQTSPEALAEELKLSGLGEAVAAIDLEGLDVADRDAVRRVSLLDRAWRNGAPVGRGEVAMLVGGVR